MVRQRVTEKEKENEKVILDEQEDHPYNAHIQSIDEDSGTLLVFLEELGVKQTVPAKNIVPLPLDIPQIGDQSFLPVTNIDLLRFIKKGRRRRHRVMPVAVVAGHIAGSPSPDRGRTISTNSTNSNASSTKENNNNNNSSNNKNTCSSKDADVSHSDGKNFSVNNSSTELAVADAGFDSSGYFYQSVNYNGSSDYSSCYKVNNNYHNSNSNITLTSTSNCHKRNYCQGSEISAAEFAHAPVAIDYSGHVTADGYSPTLGDTTVIGLPYPDYLDPCGDSNCSPVETCPVALTFTPACLRPAAGPGGGVVYPASHAPLSVMSGGSSGVTVNGPPLPPHPHPPPPAAAAVPGHLQQQQQQQQQSGYWMPVVAVPYPHQQHHATAGAVNYAWPPSHDSYGKDLPHSDVNTLRFFFNLGVEYYRMSSTGQPSNCFPPGIVFAPSPSNPADMPQLPSAATGTAVMVDATGHHHYANVLYGPQDLSVDAGSVCVGEGHSSSSSKPFVAPLSLTECSGPSSSSPSSASFIPNHSTSCGAAAVKPSPHAGSTVAPPTWSSKVKGKMTCPPPSGATTTSPGNVNNACNGSVPNASTKIVSATSSGQHADTSSLHNNNNVIKRVEVKGGSNAAKEGDTTINDEDDNASDDCGMDVGSDRDSGCSSEYTNHSPTNNVTDDSGASTFIGPTFPSSSSDTQETSSASVSGDVDQDQDGADTGLEGTSKPRGKRRYYMYGSHKLVKPIKEIPLRFQILLAETSAAKARCEGQPIYMQHQQPPQQMYDVVYYQLPDAGAQPQQQQQQQQQQQAPQAQLNANANCFIPGQPGVAQDGSQMVGPAYECYSLCYPASNTVPTNMHGFSPSSVQPTPLFVPPLQQGPPPPTGASQACSVPATSQNCQTIIVYSSQASQASVAPSPANTASQQQQHIHPVNMPPPPFPPPTSLPPPPADPMSTNSTPCLSPSVNPIVVSVPANLSQSKTNAPSIYSKPQVVLNVPPPSHPPPQTSNTNKPSVPVTQISAPPPNPCILPTNPAFLQPVPQHVALPSSSQHQQPITGVQTTSSSLPQHVSPTPYPGGPASPYMYVYPSPPAGQQGAAPQVMYMVSPAYPANAASYQQPVLVSSGCPVPVQ
ncbi:hypothetical protein PoB_005217900 [Plakobranchus ocellatus]|uniref:Uncharacterized protein n=1 Tax=Plakobranchus ocellatus TaxID=259542 RepID=A0AAV4C3E6_9GAST|nr:hypothetical protein PoB_005217900 [Plakobranchus ocellatus]